MMTEPSQPEHDGRDTMAEGLKAAFGGEPAPKQSSVHRVLQRKTGSNLDLHLHDKDEESDVPVKIDDDAKALRDPSGRYQVLGEIGRGGVGVVYKGRDQDLGRDVAIKVLRPEHVSRPEILERFVEEAQIGGQLQHPGIVPVYEIGLQSGERPYFAMKLVKGQTLAQLLAQRKSPDDDRRRFLGIFEQICQTIAYAHARRVVHRDLKPHNVMLGSFGEVQVVDWGFAKVLPLAPMAEVESPEQRKASAIASVIATVRSDPKKGSHSVAGSMMGTPAYMPPEQALGDVEHMDQRSDVFGLGAILCEILTGQPPYLAADDDLVMQAARADLQGAYTRLEKCGADAVLIALCRQCLSPARQKRPDSAKQVAEAVAQYLTSVEDRARQAQIHAAEAKVRARSTLMLSAAAVLVLALGGGGYLYVQREAQTRRDQANQRVATALNEANVRLGEARAKEPPDLALWSRAGDAATQVGQLAAEADVGGEERSHAGQMLTTVNDEQSKAIATAARLDRDVAMQQRLLEVRIQRLDEQRSDYMVAEMRRRVQGYADAFESYLGGRDVTTMGRDEAVQALSGPIAVELATGLDGWAFSRRYLGINEPKDPKDAKSPSDPVLVAQLIDLSSTIDPDPWRARLRAALVPTNRDRAAIVALYRDVDLDALPAYSMLMLGATLYEVGDAAAAEAVTEHACERFPSNFACVYDFALLFENSGRFAQAEPWLRIAHALRPDMHEAMNLLGVTLAGLGRHREEEQLFRELAEIQPGEAHWTFRVGYSLQAQGRLDEAIACYRRAIEMGPKKWFFYTNLAIAFAQQGRFDDACESNHKAMEIDPRNSVPYMNLGNDLADQGKLDESAASLRRAIELDPGNAACHYNLGLTLKAQHKPEEAIASYRRCLELNPKDAQGYNALANILTEQGRPDDAVVSSRRAIELDPKTGAYHYDLANALARQGNTVDAVAAYRRAIELDPKDGRFHMNLGNNLKYQGELDLALASYRRAAAIWSAKHDAYSNDWYPKATRAIADIETKIELRNRLLATLRGERESKDAEELCAAADLGQARGDWQLAILADQLAIGIDPNVSRYHFDLGVSFEQLRQLDDAIASYERAIALDPKDARYHGSLASALRKHGDLEEAIASYREALELDPKNVAGWGFLSRSLAENGEIDDAIDAARKAVELDPKNAFSQYNLGWYAQQKQHWDEAVDCYRKALEADPNRAEAHCNLALCLQNTGLFAEALQHARRGHELGSKLPGWSYPSAEWVRIAERRAALETKLPALLEGRVDPKDNAERVEYAIMCQIKKYHYAAAGLFAEAFAADPKITEQPGYLYDSAISPVLAAAGRGEDGSRLDERERARLRKQALDWLRADLGLYAKKMEAGKPEDRAAVQDALRKWQEEPDLGSIRDATALNLLSTEEKDAFGRLWADVADLMRGR
jgi:serine/threonine-protein kinase